MTIKLPAANDALLPRAPLELVICQVRVSAMPNVNDPGLALRIHQATGGESGPFPRMEPVRMGQLPLMPSLPGNLLQPGLGWQLKTEKNDWIVSIMNDHLAIQTTAYQGWSNFRERFSLALSAVADVMSPVLETRLGLRYIDRIVHPEVERPEQWSGLISDFMLGPVDYESFRGHVKSAQQQLELEVDEGVNAIVRHGPFADQARQGKTSYMLDFDVSRERTRAFFPDDVLSAADRFNDLCLRLFQIAITPRLFKSFAEEEN